MKSANLIQTVMLLDRKRSLIGSFMNTLQENLFISLKKGRSKSIIQVIDVLHKNFAQYYCLVQLNLFVFYILCCRKHTIVLNT